VVIGGAAYSWWRVLVGLRDGFVTAGAQDVRIDGINSVVGTLQGWPVRYVAAMRKSGLSATWTIATAAVPKGAIDVELHLRPQTARDASLVERGLAIDLIVGEPLFDAAFLVEAAPEDAVRAILDAPTRARLRALLPCELRVAEGEVLFRRAGQHTEPAVVCAVVKLVGGLASRLASVGREVEQKKMRVLQEAGLGYRGVTPLEAVAKLAEHGASRELQVLHAVRANRWAERVELVVGIAFFGAVALVILRMIASH
jgi:hypothetical protein